MLKEQIYLKGKWIVSLLCLCYVSYAQSQSNTLKIRLTASNNYYDETVIRLIDGATNSFDGNYDAWKLFSPNPDVPSIYTRTVEGYPLAINSVPHNEKDIALNLFTWVNADGDYTFEFEQIFPFDSAASLYLYDKLTATGYDLHQNATLHVHMTANTDSSARFELHVSYQPVVSVFDENCYNAHDGALLVKDIGNPNWGYALMDENLNMISSGSNISDSIYISDLSAGYYLLICSTYYSEKDSINIEVQAAEPIVVNIASNTGTVYLSEGGSVQFYNWTTGAASYLWDFGDGQTSTDKEPVHTYQQEGLYNVNMLAMQGACEQSASLAIHVIDDVSGIFSNTNQDDHVMIWADHNSIYIEGKPNKTFRCKVYDIAGHLIDMRTIDIVYNTPASYSIKLPYEGIYFLQLVNHQDVITKKIYMMK